MTDLGANALLVANAVCETQLKAVAVLVASGVAAERVTTFPSNYGGHEHDLCGVAVDGEWAAHVCWTVEPELVVIDVTWSDAWSHLARS